MKTDLAGLELKELEDFVQSLGHKKFHAKQIYHWIWKRGVTDFAEMTNLSRELRARARGHGDRLVARGRQHQVSEDGTQKFVLRLADGKQIESVFIPDTPKQTFCVSTQVGCAMGCAFCLTGKMGLIRHLSAAEIAGQVRLLARSLHLLDKSFNIVLMGMGEPLQNYDNTMKALRMLNEKEGLDMHPKRVTLSTVGLVPQMDRLAKEELMPNLAVSLHAATEEQRAAIVPPSKKYTMQDVIDACKRFPLSKRRRIMFEYVMLAGVNDSPDDARKLVKVLAGVKAKVNLLPLNAAAGIPFERPSDERINAFAKILADRGLMVSVRKSRGRDIRAACGQLIVEGQAPGNQPARSWPLNHEGAKTYLECLGCHRFGARYLRHRAMRAANVVGLAAAALQSRARGAGRGHREVHRVEGRDADRREPDAPDLSRQGQGRTVARASSATSTAGRRRRRATTSSIGTTTRIEGTTWSYLESTSYTNARLEYVFLYDKEYTSDPMNQRMVQAFAGPRSEVRMPFFVAQPEVDELGSAPKGELIAESLIRDRSAASGASGSTCRPDTTLQRDALFPVIYVLDGSNYVEKMDVPSVLDHLIANKSIPPVIAVFSEPADRQEEYSRNPKWRAFIASELVPAVDKRFRTFPTPDHRVILGSSLAAYGAIDLAVAAPSVFGLCAAIAPPAQTATVVSNQANARAAVVSIKFFVMGGVYD